MNDFIQGPQLSHPPDGPGGLLSQDKPLNHGMNDAVSTVGQWRNATQAHLLKLCTSVQIQGTLVEYFHFMIKYTRWRCISYVLQKHI